MSRVGSMLDHPAVSRFDSAADKAFEPLRANKLANRIFYGLSEAANHSILWHVFTWGRAALFPSRRQHALAITAALAAESALVNGPIKAIFRRSRPGVDQPRPHRLRQPKTSSFPSGHATSAFCAVILLSHKSRFRPAYLALAIAVSVSRLHVKVHHASDVVGGATIGIVMGRLAERIVFKSSRNGA